VQRSVAQRSAARALRTARRALTRAHLCHAARRLPRGAPAARAPAALRRAAARAPQPLRRAACAPRAARKPEVYPPEWATKPPVTARAHNTRTHTHRFAKTSQPPRRPLFLTPALSPALFPARRVRPSRDQVREEVQGRVERAPAPSWATFAGAAGGVWRGSVVAASPFTGAVEALALDGDGKPTVTGAWTRRVVRALRGWVQSSA
jgi:hypothetical protein